MYKAYKFRIQPNTEQEIALAKSFGCCRWFWNYSLNLCLQTYKTTGKGLTRGVIQGLLPGLKKEYPWLIDAYSQCLQVVALNLSRAYQNFFEKRARLPRFKSKHGRQSISYPANVKLEGDYLKLPKIGLVYCIRHRDFEGTIKTVTISKNPDGKYYASVLVDDGQEKPTQSTDKAIRDWGWGMFCTMLKYKAENEGKTYIEVERFFPSSKTCNVCLNQVGSLPLDIRNWTCEHCQTNHDRDVNAAKNIRNEALRILSLGTSDTANLRGCKTTGKTSVLLDPIPIEVGSLNYTACG